jgi:hypothetical protein
MDIHSEDCRCDWKLSWCTKAIDFPQWLIWWMDYCSISLLHHTSYGHLQHCILSLSTLRNERKKQVITSSMEGYQTRTRQSDWKVSIKHGVNVIHSITHLIRSDESRNNKFINGARTPEAFLVWAQYSYLASGWNYSQCLLPHFGISNKGELRC